MLVLQSAGPHGGPGFPEWGMLPLPKKLLQQGVIVRPIGGYGLPNHLRVTIGLETENARFLDALEKSL